MKVLYYIGETVGGDTIMKKGVIEERAFPIVIEPPAIVLNDLKSVAFYKLGFGTMIKVQNGPDTIYLTVPRLFIDKGTGFAIINLLATKRLKRILDSQLH